MVNISDVQALMRIALDLDPQKYGYTVKISGEGFETFGGGGVGIAQTVVYDPFLGGGVDIVSRETGEVTAQATGFDLSPEFALGLSDDTALVLGRNWNEKLYHIDKTGQILSTLDASYVLDMKDMPDYPEGPSALIVDWRGPLRVVSYDLEIRKEIDLGTTRPVYAAVIDNQTVLIGVREGGIYSDSSFFLLDLITGQ
jgi:hypothetical protein